jgi:AraC-like DNA-binding protein
MDAPDSFMYFLEIVSLYVNNGTSSPGLLSLAGVSQERQNPPILGMRVLDRFALVFLYEGQGVLEQTDCRPERLAPGSCLLIRPGIPHRYRPDPGSVWSEVFFVFGGPIFDAWGQSSWLPRPMHFLLAPVKYWLQAFLRCLPEDQKDPLQTTLESVCRIQALLAEIVLYRNKGRLHHEDRVWLDRARDAIERVLAEHRDLPAAAAYLHMPYDAFRKRFARVSGRTPSSYLATLRSDRACRMLLETTRTLSDIAEDLGYCDAFHFSKAFKKSVGSSPSHYRRDHA